MPSRLIQALVLSFCMALCCNPPARAATSTWWASGSAGSVGGVGTWDTSNARWTTDGSTWSAWNNAGLDTAVFGGATTGTVTLSTGITAGGLTFNTTGYTVAGNTLTLSNASGTATVDVSANAAAISSVIAGTATLLKVGSGTVTLSGNNSYSGGTVINAGTVVGGQDGSVTGNSLPFGSGPITVNGALVTGNVPRSVGGGWNTTRALTLNSGTWNVDYAGGGGEYVKSLTLNSGLVTSSNGSWFRAPNGGLSISSLASSGTSVIASRFDLSFSDLALDVADGAATIDLAINGAITQNTDVPGAAKSITKSGAGTVALSGANTYTGGTVINAGTVQIGSGGTAGSLAGSSAISGSASAILAFNRTDNYGGNFANSISGAIGVSNIGTGTLTLSASNSYTGTTRLTGGVLSLGNANALAGGGNVTFSGGTLQYGSGITTDLSGRMKSSSGAIAVDTGSNASIAFASAIDSTNVGGLTKSGTGTLTLSGNNSYSGGTVINAGALQIGSGGTAGSLAASSAISGSAGAILAFNRTDNYGGNFANTISGAIGVSNIGTGTLTLSASNSYTGTTRLTGGVLSLGNANALAGGGNVTFSGGTLQYGSGITTDLSGRMKSSSGAMAVDTGSNAAITFASAIDSTNVGGLTKSGTGTLTLSGISSYSGGTVINAGTVIGGVNAPNGGQGYAAAFGSGPITVNNAQIEGSAVFSVGGASQTTRAITLNSGTWNVDYAGGGGEYVKSLTLNSGLVTSSNGSWFRAPNGGLSISSLASSGTSVIAMRFDLTFSDLALDVADGAATIDLAINGAITQNTDVGGAAKSITKSGAGTVALSGATSYTGTTTLTGGVLSLGNANALGGGGNVTFSGGTLQYGSGITTDLSGRMKSSSGAIAVDTGSNAAIAFASAIDSTNVGGLTKSGTGTLTLSASNGFTGATNIAAGVISINTASALQSTSGVSIAGGAGLAYTGGAGTISRDITVASGIGTVTNSGGNTLTLAGTLTKNGSVLQLAGGAFNVTGQIVGSSANSDLYVNGASVTLSNTNSYNGPTFIFNSGTLALGVNDAIPSNSVVTLGGSGTGSATGPGTLDLGANTNTIGGLVFSGSGNTLKMAANQTAAPQLATSSSLTPGAGNTLDLTGMGNSAGLYKLVSYTSNTGTFTNVNGLAAGYQLVYGTTDLNAQQKAVLGTVTVTNPAVSIITGGSAAFSYTVANDAASGGASLSFTGTGLSNVAGASGGSAAAAGASSAVTGLYFTGTGVGSSQTGTFSVSAPVAYGLTAATGTVTVNVLDHATSSLASTLLTGTTISLGQWNFATQTWESGGSTGNFSIYNLASLYGPNNTAALSLLSVSGTGNGFSTDLNAFVDIVGGSSSQFSILFDPTGFSSAGTQSATFTIAMSDKTSLSGAAASNTLSVTASVIVVPEPGSLALAAIGAAAVAWAASRWRGKPS